MIKYQDIYMMLDANAITNVVDAYQQGRADVLNQVISDLENILDNTYIKTHSELELYVKQLKEKKNE